MKMYLSSFRLGDQPEKLSALFGENKKIVVIVNAIDELQSAEERSEKVAREILWLSQLGLEAIEIDLRQYFNKTSELRLELEKFAGVWVRGGNTFILARAFKLSGFDSIIKQKSNQPDFVYAGYSAGICILTPNLHGLELVDNPQFIPTGYEPEIVWDGLNLLNYHIAPHYKSPNHPESPLVEKSVEYFINHKMNYRTLRDGEVIICD